MTKRENERALEKVARNMCPAKNWDFPNKIYVCFQTGLKCEYDKRDSCDIYKSRILPMRKA